MGELGFKGERREGQALSFRLETELTRVGEFLHIVLMNLSICLSKTTSGRRCKHCLEWERESCNTAKVEVLPYLVWVTDCWAAVADISYSITITVFLIRVRNSYTVVRWISDSCKTCREPIKPVGLFSICSKISFGCKRWQMLRTVESVQ